jgi:hypothetical protein
VERICLDKNALEIQLPKELPQHRPFVVIPGGVAGLAARGIDIYMSIFCEAVGKMARKLRKKEGREIYASPRQSCSRCLVRPKKRKGCGGFYCVGWRR